MSSRKPTDPLRSLMNARVSLPKSPTSTPVFPQKSDLSVPSQAYDTLLAQFADLQQRFDEQQELIQSLERDASSDPLTGLANRRTLEKELDRSLATARRYGRRHALLLIDLNDFKSINDQLGHAMGDQVLQHVARLLRQNIRPTDIAARLGGDEFCVILNELRAIENAETRAQDITNVLNRTPCIGEQRTVQLSASVGYYVFTSDDDKADIMARADENMYAHKPRHD